MREQEASNLTPDPHRLAVLAVRVVLGVLGDDDLATVIRLNGPVDGEEPLRLGPLDRDQRDRIEQSLDLAAPLASYDGGFTPCRTALETAAELLEGADRPGASQVVIFLTDGKCTPDIRQSRSGRPDVPGGQSEVRGVLNKIYSHREGRFQFFLLKFEGTTTSPSLFELARDTGTDPIEVQRGDPTRVLSRFAEALARSQNYESQVLSAAKPDLSAHRGADRVRLLTVVPGGTNKPLKIRVTDDQGRPVPTQEISADVHQYQNGKRYRFASVAYRPVNGGVQVAVEGAGGSWEVVALPEYHLQPVLRLFTGSCAAQEGELGADQIPAGQEICAVIELQNQLAEAVGRDVTAGEISGQVNWRSQSGAAPEIRLASLDPAGGVRFAAPVRLEEGSYRIEGEIYLSPPESQQRTLRTTPRVVHVVDRSLMVRPSALDLGKVYPGAHIPRDLELDGGFSPGLLRAELVDPAAIPSCFQLTFGAKPLGELVAVQAGQERRVELVASEECSTAESQEVSTALRLVLDQKAGGAEATVPLSFSLDSAALVLEPRRLRLRAGESRKVPLDSETEVTYKAALLPFHDLEDGSEQADLRLHLAEPSPVSPQSGEEPEVVHQQLTLGPSHHPQLVVHADSCCSTGTFKSDLRLLPAGGGQTVVQPLLVEVQGSWWVCWRARVIAFFVAFLLLLLLSYLVSMFTHSSLLSTKLLLARLTPLVWPAYGGAPQPSSAREGHRDELEDILRHELRLTRRAWSWLRANPLYFGLPGKSYHETLELSLAPNMANCDAVLVGRRDLVGELEAKEEIDPMEEGRLFARAGGGNVSFHAVLGPQRRVGRLVPERWYESPDRCRLRQLRAGQQLIQKLRKEERRQGHIAGWKLG